MGDIISSIPRPAFDWGEDVFRTGLGSGTTTDLVSAKFNTTMEAAEDMRSLFIGYLSNLNASLEAYNVGSITVPTVTAPTLDESTITAPSIPSDGGLLAALLDRLIADLTSGATGIDAAVEQAIWDRADDRLTVVEEAQQEEIEEYFSSRGFPLPPLAMAARLQEHVNERARSRNDLNDKILIQSSELAQKNSQFVIGVARELRMGLLSGEVDIFKERSSAQTERNKAFVELFDSEVKAADMAVRAAIAQIEAGVNAYGVYQGLVQRLAESMANMAMQAMSSLYGAVNASAGLSHQTQRSESESWGHNESRSDDFNHGESVNESHDYKEK